MVNPSGYLSAVDIREEAAGAASLVYPDQAAAQVQRHDVAHRSLILRSFSGTRREEACFKKDCFDVTTND